MKDKIRLFHILEAINNIEVFCEGQNLDAFRTDLKLRFAVERQLEIIGEASKHISHKLKEEYIEIEWLNIVGLRNFLAHEYFGVDLELLWDFIHSDVPKLKLSVKSMLVPL